MERLKQNMKQDILANDICSTSHLSKIEHGTTVPSDFVQQQLLQRLNISLENAVSNSSPVQFIQFRERFQDAINRRDKLVAESLCQEIHSYLETHPLYDYRFDLLLMETRLLLMTSTDVTAAKSSLDILVATKNELSNNQIFHLYTIQGIIAYKENRFTNALNIFKDACKLSQKYRMEDWEMAELHYVLSLAALSDYRYILAIDHSQEAIAYFNTKMLAKRSIESLLILGIAQKHSGDVEDALVTFKLAKEIVRNTETTNFGGVIEQNLGTCYSLLGNSELSLYHFNQSLSANDTSENQIITILSLVKEHKKIDDRETAKEWVQKGITLLEQLPEHNKNPSSHHFAVYKALLVNDNDFTHIFKSAIRYFEEKQNYYRCFVYCNILAEKLAENNQFKLATTFYQKAFEYHLTHRKVNHWEELT